MPLSTPIQGTLLNSSQYGCDIDGRIREPGLLPSMAVLRDASGELFICTHGRFKNLGAQPFTPGERPEMSHEAQVRFDLGCDQPDDGRRAGPLYFTGIRYEGDWRNIERYASMAPRAVLQRYGNSTLVQELYDDDEAFATALRALIGDSFEYPDFAGRTIKQVLSRYPATATAH